MPRVVLVLLFLLVVGGTAAAFALTESLKLETAAVARPKFIGPDGEAVARNRVFSPVCECPQSTAELEFRLRRADRVSATIVNAREEPVRVLAEDERLARGIQRLTWDGRDDSGALVADGPYRLRLVLSRADREFLVPMVFRVDTRPPKVALVRAGPTTITPNVDGEQDKIWVRYRSNEAGAPRLTVDGVIASQGGIRKPGRSALSWRGRLAGEPVAPGTYELSLVVRDRAGNVSEPIGPIDVTVQSSAAGAESE